MLLNDRSTNPAFLLLDLDVFYLIYGEALKLFIERVGAMASLIALAEASCI
jgi:hypothetical protein